MGQEFDEDKFDEGMPGELVKEWAQANDALYKVKSKVVAWRLQKLKKEPECPSCGAGVIRPKCFYEFGSACPRHKIISFFGGHTKLNNRLKELKGKAP